MSETTEHTAAAIKLMQVNGQLLARAETAEAEALRIHHEKANHFEARIAAEARCKRLEGALGRVMDLKAGGPHISAEDGMSAALCTLDRARDIASDALSDTAQQETGILCDSGGGSNLLAVMTDHKAAEMRERAAKLCDNKALCHKGTTSLFGDEAALQLSKAIRALPIDPETGGK